MNTQVIFASVPEKIKEFHPQEHWLLGQVSQGAVLWDEVAVVAKRIARGQVRINGLARIVSTASTP